MHHDHTVAEIPIEDDAIETDKTIGTYLTRAMNYRSMSYRGAAPDGDGRAAQGVNDDAILHVGTVTDDDRRHLTVRSGFVSPDYGVRANKHIFSHDYLAYQDRGVVCVCGPCDLRAVARHISFTRHE
jgi:hypothetical protein